MKPVIAIVGRPNVGKSTLFNCLTKSRNALVADLPGVTRDRLYGEGMHKNRGYIVIDTGGMESEEPGITDLMTRQAFSAIEESDAVLFMVDAREGLNPIDEKICDHLRQITKPLFLVINKIDGLDIELAKTDFYKLGLKNLIAISAAHCRGIPNLLDDVFSYFPKADYEEAQPSEEGIKIAIVGRPNVGKSTLVNRILGEERVLVYDEPGTTRDSIFIPFQHHNRDYTLIDTAGVRRRTKIHDVVEKFSVIKALQAIEAANVVIFVFSARENVSDQDLRLLDFIIDSGRALVIAINKWDGMDPEQREHFRSDISRRLAFVNFARMHFISALHGTGVGNLFKSIDEAYEAAIKPLGTPLLTRVLQSAVTQHQPPLVQGRRIKLRFAHCGGHNPPLIIIHGNQTESLPNEYIRYLGNYFRKQLKLVGTPIRIELKAGINPYAHRKNVLTPRQKKKRKRLIKHLKKNK